MGLRDDIADQIQRLQAAAKAFWEYIDLQEKDLYKAYSLLEDRMLIRWSRIESRLEALEKEMPKSDFSYLFEFAKFMNKQEKHDYVETPSGMFQCVKCYFIPGLQKDRPCQTTWLGKKEGEHYQNHHLEHFRGDAMRCTRCKKYFSATYPPPEGLCRPAKPKRKIVRYVNIYPDETTVTHETFAEAESWASGNRIACKRIEIEFEEGEFDK